MAACLYDPDGGFFTSGPLRSVKEGDFLTSPEVSPWFGRTLAEFVRREAERVSSPLGGGAAAGGGGGFLVVDVGAGSGSLLKPMMETLASPSGKGGGGAAGVGEVEFFASPSGGGAERSEAEGVKPPSRARPNPPPGPDGPDSPLRGEQFEFRAVEASHRRRETPCARPPRRRSRSRDHRRSPRTLRRRGDRQRTARQLPGGARRPQKRWVGGAMGGGDRCGL